MKKQGFLFGSMILVVSVVITKIIGLVFKIPLANILGGTGMGYFSCAYAIFLPVYAVSVTGLPAAVSRMVAENMALHRYKNVKKIKRAGILGFSAVGLAAALLIVLLAKPFTAYIGNAPALPAIAAIAPCVFFSALISVYRGYFEGLHNMVPTALSQIIEAAVKLVCGLGLAYAAMNYFQKSYEKTGMLLFCRYASPELAKTAALPYIAAAAVLGITLSSAVSLLYLFLRYRLSGDGITKAMLTADTSTDRMRSLLKTLFAIVIPIAIGSVVTNLTSLIDLGTIIRTLDKTIHASPEYFSQGFKYALDESTGLDELPNFIYGSFTGLALTVFNLVPSITGMFGKGAFPNLTEAWAVGDYKKTNKSIRSVLLLTSIVAFPAGLGIFVLGGPVLKLLYSSRTAEIQAVSSSMTVLGIGVIFLSLSIPVFAMLQAVGRSELPIKIMLFGVFIKFIGNIILMAIPELNVTGAALSTVACYAVICIMSISSLKKITRVRLDIPTIFIKPLFGGILCGAAAYLCYDLAVSSFQNSTSVLLAVGGGASIYFLSLGLMNISAVRELKAAFFKKHQ